MVHFIIARTIQLFRENIHFGDVLTLNNSPKMTYYTQETQFTINNFTAFPQETSQETHTHTLIATIEFQTKSHYHNSRTHK